MLEVRLRKAASAVASEIAVLLKRAKIAAHRKVLETDSMERT